MNGYSCRSVTSSEARRAKALSRSDKAPDKMLDCSLFVGQDPQGAERRASDPAYSNQNVFAREDTLVADRSNLLKFLKIASSLDDSLLATTLWNSTGRSKSRKAPSGRRWDSDVSLLKKRNEPISL